MFSDGVFKLFLVLLWVFFLAHVLYASGKF